MRENGKEYALSCSWKNRAKQWSTMLGLNKMSSIAMAHNNNYMVDNYHYTEGIKFLTYPPDKCIISELISKNHVWEPHMHKIFEKYINKESIVLEGGCHIGTHTLKLGLLGKQVLSFEPMTNSNVILRENLKINNITNVTVYNEGLSNKTDVAYFEWIGHNNPGASGLANNPMGKPSYTKPIEKKHPVTLITIDSLQLEKLDFIKLDVEGYEINVIEGAIDTIKKCNPIITLEIYENFTGNYSLQHAKSTFKILLDNGYTIHHIQGPDFLFLPSSKPITVG
jgi:FkbM family methyltransferase